MGLPIAQLEKQIIREHDLAVSHASAAIQHALECGKLLTVYRQSLAGGEWCERLEKLGIARTTATRYCKLALDAAKNPNKVKYLLEQGASLVDLYREFALVKPVVSGGYRPEVYQRRVANEQLELDFSFEEFTPHIKSLIKARNVEELAPSTLQRIKAELVEAQKRIDAVLAEKGAINLENHQP